ncbi:MAG TPA: hypothetical protein VK718_03645 [Ferruginibacter sp.]|jgi:hypothetical protein|nr:hypothetical protein [Ferruginibacter sp.]
MKDRFKKYVAAKRKVNNPIQRADQIQTSHDKHIDQDFTGYPDAPAKENIINPKTKEEKKTAAVDFTDGEKTNKPDDEIDEQDSDGSGGAFSETEELIDDEE